MCWVIHTVVARSWAVSGRVNHNLQLTTICALLATVILYSHGTVPLALYSLLYSTLQCTVYSTDYSTVGR